MPIIDAHTEDCTDLLLDALLRSGGHLFVRVEAYFDESNTHDDSRIMCVAGYIIEKRQALKLATAWRKQLNRYHLPYFHMVDCAQGTGAFANLSPTQRTVLQTRLIEIIKRRTIMGLAFTIVPSEFQRHMQANRLLGSCYSFSTRSMMAGVSAWVSKNPHVKQMAYFFEAGHKSQNEANNSMQMLFLNEGARKAHKYVAHSFVDKEQCAPVQAADLLAWHWYKDKKNEMEGKPRRKDCESLLQHPHQVVHLDPERISHLSKAFQTVPGFSDFANDKKLSPLPA